MQALFGDVSRCIRIAGKRCRPPSRALRLEEIDRRVHVKRIQLNQTQKVLLLPKNQNRIAKPMKKSSSRQLYGSSMRQMKKSYQSKK
jgi:hypothetical protein